MEKLGNFLLDNVGFILCASCVVISVSMAAIIFVLHQVK